MAAGRGEPAFHPRCFEALARPGDLRGRLVAGPSERAAAREASSQRLQHSVLRRDFVASLVLIGITAALGVTPWSHMRGNRPSNYEMPAGIYQTGIGETQKISLSDGTEITLNTRSSLVVSYSPSSRDVFLRYGEATFDVSPDKNRPFKVSTPADAYSKPSARASTSA